MTSGLSVVSMHDEEHRVTIEASAPGAPDVTLHVARAQGPAMPPRVRLAIGTVNAVTGVAALAALVAAYGLSERLVVAQEGAATGTLAQQAVRWWGPDLSVTLNMSLLLLGAAAGVVGSVVQQSIVFALRAGHDTLGAAYVWWYVLRPVWSALLGALVVVAVNTGLVSIGDTTTSTAGVTVLATAGALAGLFTDQALQRLQHLLGATDPATQPGA
jgi:hypothetical protein